MPLHPALEAAVVTLRQETGQFILEQYPAAAKIKFYREADRENGSFNGVPQIYDTNGDRLDDLDVWDENFRDALGRNFDDWVDLHLGGEFGDIYFEITEPDGDLVRCEPFGEPEVPPRQGVTIYFGAYSSGEVAELVGPWTEETNAKIDEIVSQWNMPESVVMVVNGKMERPDELVDGSVIEFSRRVMEKGHG